MKNIESYIYPKETFSLSANCYCGVYMPTDVMKKVCKVLLNKEIEIKKILNENIEKLLVADWTGAFEKNSDGKILEFETIDYAIIGESYLIERRINLFKFLQPKRIQELYIVSSYEEAREIAQIKLDAKKLENETNK